MSQQPQNGPGGPAPEPGPIHPLVEIGQFGKPQTASRGPFAEVRGYRDRVRHVWWPDGRVTGGKRRSRPPSSRHLVDVGEHQSSMTVDLPARGGTLHFAAVVQLVWRVVDPLRAVDLGLLDVGAALEPKLVHRLSRITADFAIDQPAAANQRVGDWLDSEEGLQLGADHGLQAHAYARLRSIAEVETAVGKGVVDEILNVQLQEEVRVISQFIAAGDISGAALVMAKDPNQIAEVMGEIWGRERTSREQTFAFLTDMVKSGVVERHEISDKIQAVLSWMEGAASGIILERPRQLPELENGSRERSRRPPSRPVADDEDRGWDDPPARRQREQGRPRRPRRTEVIVEVVPDSDEEKPDENIRVEYSDISDPYERPERAERREWSERSDRTERYDRPERAERYGRSEHSDHFDRPSRASQSEPESWSGQFDDWGDDE